MGLSTGIAKRLQTGSADVIPMPAASPEDNQVLVHQAGVFVWQGMVGGGDMLGANNLSELTDRAAARANLDLEPGTDVQAWDADLNAIAALTTAAFGRSLLEQASAGDVRALIGAGTSNFDGAFLSLAGLPTTLAGYGIIDAAPLAHTHIIGEVTGLQSALDGKASVSHSHAQSEITNLVSDLADKADLVGGKVPSSQLPAAALGEYLGAVANQAAMLALTAQTGDTCSRTDTSTFWQLLGSDPTLLANWWEYSVATGAVTSVNGYTGTVVLSHTDVGAAQASHTHIIADVTGLQAALDGKASTSHTHTLADITNAGSAAAFDETDFAAALHGHPQSDITSLVSDLAAKAPLASPTLTGVPAAPTATPGTNTTQIATTAFVTAAVAAGGGGAIDIFGTPAAGELMVWHDPDTATGDDQLVWDGSYLDIIDSTASYCLRLGEKKISVGGTIANPDWALTVSHDYAARTGRVYEKYGSGHGTQGQLVIAGSNPTNPGYGGISLGGADHPSIAGTVRFFSDSTQRGILEHDGIWNFQTDVQVRDGLNARDLSVYKSYSSTTSFERIILNATDHLSEHRIYSESGSGGGTYHDLVFGACPAGTFTEAFRIDSTGSVVFSAVLTDLGTPQAADRVLVMDVSDGNRLRYAEAAEFGGGGGGGTVTSVAVSGSDGLEVDSGSPITTSGTIALGVNKASMIAHLSLDTGTLNGTFGDGVNVVISGTKTMLQIKRNCTITGWRVAEVDGVSGTIEFDIWRDTNANFPPTVADTITGSGTKPNLSSQSTNESTDVTGWVAACNAGDWLVFNAQGSIANVKRVLLKLDITWS
jgi:hypothetical protein